MKLQKNLLYILGGFGLGFSCLFAAIGFQLARSWDSALEFNPLSGGNLNPFRFTAYQFGIVAVFFLMYLLSLAAERYLLAKIGSLVALAVLFFQSFTLSKMQGLDNFLPSESVVFKVASIGCLLLVLILLVLQIRYVWRKVELEKLRPAKNRL